MCVKVVGGVFRIPLVRQEDRGVYICEAENSAGTDFATVTIEIESTFITFESLKEYCNHLCVCVCLSVCTREHEHQTWHWAGKGKKWL